MTVGSNARGRRRQKIIDGGTTTFLYEGLNAVQETTGSGVANLITGLGLDEVLMRAEPEGTSHLLTDALGNVLALADSSGSIATEYTYEPFGATSATGVPSSNVTQFTGRENDATGLYYYRARYYHPGLQRFISEDPLRFVNGDPNFYAYVGNNPMSFSDPLGLCADPGGTGIRYCIDRYIPGRTGGGSLTGSGLTGGVGNALGYFFEGDNRGPNPDGGGARYRITVYQRADGSTGVDCDQGESVVIGGLFARPGVDGGHGGEARPLPLGGRKIKVFCSGYNGVTAGIGDTPPIYTEMTIIEGADGQATVVSAHGTTFPAIEVWQYGRSGGPQNVWNYSPPAGKGPGNLLDGSVRLK